MKFSIYLVSDFSIKNHPKLGSLYGYYKLIISVICKVLFCRKNAGHLAARKTGEYGMFVTSKTFARVVWYTTKPFPAPNHFSSCNHYDK